MATLVKAEDTGDRDKHEGLRGRSQGGAAENLQLWLEASLPAAAHGEAPGVAEGMRQGWLCSPP